MVNALPSRGDLLFWQPTPALPYMLLAVVLDTRKLRLVASSAASRVDDLAGFLSALPRDSFRLLRDLRFGEDAAAGAIDAFDAFGAKAFDVDTLATTEGWVDVTEKYRSHLKLFHPRLHHDHPLASFWGPVRRARVCFGQTLLVDGEGGARTYATAGPREHLVRAVAAARGALHSFPAQLAKGTAVADRIAGMHGMLDAMDAAASRLASDAEAYRIVPGLQQVLRQGFEDLAVAAVPTRYPITGDLVLLEPVGGPRSMNTLLQTLATGRRVRFSHVAIVLDQYQAIHALPDGGVQPVMLNELLATRRPDGFEVLRHAEADWNDDLRDALHEGILYHHRQGYNHRFLLRGNNRSSFCSELAAKAFARIERPLFATRPSRVLPGHIARLAGAAGWIDVTDAYRALGERERQLSPGLRDRLLGGGVTPVETIAADMIAHRRRLVDTQKSILDLGRASNNAARTLGLEPAALPKMPLQSWETDPDA